MSEKDRPVLSISMLVSNNRRDTIEKCMESLVPLMRAVPSELIIVDTGCTDGSVDIARMYADKVIQFTWCNDFSAARNAGLTECTGQWFLYLDDDEWFENVSELIAFLQSEEKDACDALWYLQRNYDNFEGTTYTDTYVGRMVKLTPDTKFCGKIHEWLDPVPKMIKKTKAYVHHYGYVYKSEEDRLKHLERNLTLEEEAVKENPKDIRMCCQLVQEYRAARRYEDAMRLAEETLKNTEYPVNNSFVQYLRLVIPKIYNEMSLYEKALESFEGLEAEGNLLHQTKLGVYYEKALTYGYLKREEDLIREELCYLNEFHEQPKAGDFAEHPVMDFAQYQSEFFYQRAVEYAVTNMVCGDLYSYAGELFQRINWKTTVKPKEMLLALVRSYIETGEASLLREHIPCILETGNLENQMYAALHSAYESYPEKREKFLTDLESLQIQSGNFPYFHLLYTESKGITTEQDLMDYYEKSDRKYDAEVVALLFFNEELLFRVLLRTPVELYREAVSLLVNGKSAKELEVLWTKLPSLELYYPGEMLSFLYYAVMVVAEGRLISAMEQSSGVRVCLEEYMEAGMRYAEELYRPELLNEIYGLALPANLRFIYAMKHAMELEADFARWGDGIKRAAKEYPAMLPVVKALLEERKQSNEKNTANSAQQELLALAEQLKVMVRAQLAEGKTEEAKAILSELAEMLPEDAEVKALLGR